jgi:hypothetical protein
MRAAIYELSGVDFGVERERERELWISSIDGRRE